MPAQALLPAGETAATDKAAAGKAAEKAENAAATAGQTAGGPATEITIYNQDLALIGQFSENKYNKVNCGIMDQFAIAM